MNSNRLTLLAIPPRLFFSFFHALKARRSQEVSVRGKASIRITPLVSLIGGIRLWRRMTRSQSSTPELAPLPAQSQVIIQQWDKPSPHATRSCLSGRDGSRHWSYQDQSPCTVNPYVALANGIMYQKGAIPNKQEICVQASRLNDGAELWSTTIHSSQPPNNLTMGIPNADKMLVVR